MAIALIWKEKTKQIEPKTDLGLFFLALGILLWSFYLTGEVIFTKILDNNLELFLHIVSSLNNMFLWLATTYFTFKFKEEEEEEYKILNFLTNPKQRIHIIIISIIVIFLEILFSKFLFPSITICIAFIFNVISLGVLYSSIYIIFKERDLKSFYYLVTISAVFTFIKSYSPVNKEIFNSSLGSFLDPLFTQTIIYDVSGFLMVILYFFVAFSWSERDLQISNLELEKKNIDLEKDKIKLTQYARLITHDIKAPVRHIKAFSKIIIDNKKYKDIMSEKDFDNILYINKAGILLTDVISSTQMQMNLEESKFKNINILDVIKNVSTIISIDLEEKKGTINTPQKIPVVYGVTENITALFLNILSNSIKYSKENEALIISIKFSTKEGFIKFQIKDNGIGIKEESIHQLFELFFTEKGKTQNSTGMGLYICKEIINGHGGTIGASSILGEYTEIWFTLPLSKEHTN